MGKDTIVSNLHDMKLPSDLKEILWREKLVNNEPLMHLVRILSEHYFNEDYAEAKKTIQDFTDIHHLLHDHEINIFGARHKVPESVYYALFARPFLEFYADQLPPLSLDTHQLIDRLNAIDKAPDSVTHHNNDVLARICHYIEIVNILQDFKKSLRSGRTSLELPNEHNNFHVVEDLHKRYKFVEHVKHNFRRGYEIVGDAYKHIIDIDHFLNHFEAAFTWYMRLGAQEGDRILNADHLYTKLNFVETAECRTAFRETYDHYKSMHPRDGYEAYYDFAQNCLNPIHILNVSEVDLSSQDLCNILKWPRAQHNDNFSAALMTQFNQASAVSALSYNIGRLWGAAKTPFYRIDETADLHTILSDHPPVKEPKTILDEIFNYHCRLGIDVYDVIAQKNGLDAFSPS